MITIAKTIYPGSNGRFVNTKKNVTLVNVIKHGNIKSIIELIAASK